MSVRKFLSVVNRAPVFRTSVNFTHTARSPGKDCGIVTIQDAADFTNKVTNNSHPVLVNFHATWCRPCKSLAPRLENIMKKHMEKVLLAKVDVDSQADLASKYNVSSVPTLIAMKDGKEVGRLNGLKEEGEIEKFIQGLCK